MIGPGPQGDASDSGVHRQQIALSGWFTGSREGVSIGSAIVHPYALQGLRQIVPPRSL